MKELTKQMLDEYARKTGSPLKKWIAEYLCDEFDNYDDWKELVRDHMHDAVMNGMTPLIYNSDIEKFYNSYCIEISIALGFLMQEVGTWNIKDVIKDWDISDPLAVGPKNHFLLCAFAFDYGLEFLLAELGIDIYEL